MQIISETITHVVKTHEIQVKHKGKKFSLHVDTLDGKYHKGAAGVRTSYLTYFNENSDKVREKHAKAIKQLVENYQPKK